MNPSTFETANSTESPDYVTRVFDNPSAIPAAEWQALLHAAHAPDESISPFVSLAYAQALHRSGSACPQTGWSPQWLSLWQGERLVAATTLYGKSHSRGEYVFDWSWAHAHERHGLRYYPKGVAAVPFTPVPGRRLLAVDALARQALIAAMVQHARAQDWSSLHVLFLPADEADAAQNAGWSLRPGVQFHWQNQGWPDFEGFLASLQQSKRKKIKQEQRKVADAGVHFEVRVGAQITAQDWAFFYRCYETTYYEHGNPPYLTPAFFAEVAQNMTPNWVMFIARHGDQAIAASLVGLSDDGRVAYGRYWGALAHVPCLHFDACYYQPLTWCIANGVQRFEGGAQGEHKMARALMPSPTASVHWLAHPGFAEAVQAFTQEESQAVREYQTWLDGRSPFKASPGVQAAD